MNAVIYIPGSGNLFPLTKVRLKPMLPVLNRPILEHQITQLQQCGITQIKVVLHKHPEQVDRYFQNGERLGVKLSYSLEKSIPGDFGCLRRFRSFVNEPFLFCNSNSYNALDIRALMQRHRCSNALLTIAAVKFHRLINFHAVAFDDENRLAGFEHIKETLPKLQTQLNSQIYVCSPELLEYLSDKSIKSFEEDLIPRLLEQGKYVEVLTVDGVWEPLTQLSYYWTLNTNMLKGVCGDVEIPGKEIAPGVFVGSNTKIKTNLQANIKGPVLIGNDTIIKNNVTIDGPTIIGNNVKIDEGATIDQGIICDNTYVGKMIEVKRAVADKRWHISVPNLFATFVEEDFILGEHYRHSFQTMVNRFLIDAFDRTIALIALILLSPLFLIVTILIKRDSKGSVFYISERLKRPDIKVKEAGHYQFLPKESIKYYVFRTMYEDADKYLKNIQVDNVYDDGPYNKFKNDPRVTKIGRVLRKLSIDELPLLINVLKGDMSLVGIWALPPYEAEYLENQGLKTAALDLSEMAKVRFGGRLGLAGYWQARGRSKLSAEERALHDSFQAATFQQMGNDIGEYGEILSFKGYLKILIETFFSVIKCRGAQ